MDKYKITEKIEQFAPLELQEKWDCSGWISDLPNNSEVNKIMFALTVTPDVYNQAKMLDCDMIISHHPLFFVPFEYKDINIYCAHTNLDRTNGGTTDTLIKNLNFEISESFDFVRIVKLRKPITVNELRDLLLKISPHLRYVNNNNATKIKTIGFCAGSGAEFIKQTNTDAFVTGDLKFHTALETNSVVFDIGHFESEVFAKELLHEISEVKEMGVFANEKSPFI